MSRSALIPVAGLALALAACAQLTGEGGEMAGMPGGGDCGAAERQDLIGQSFTVLNDATLPEDARVLFPGAVVTQDFAPGRLNITVGTNDRIERIYCG
jgi:hypothetical protein